MLLVTFPARLLPPTQRVVTWGRQVYVWLGVYKLSMQFLHFWRLTLSLPFSCCPPASYVPLGVPLQAALPGLQRSQVVGHDGREILDDIRTRCAAGEAT